MVRAVRGGEAMRVVARRFAVSVSVVSRWVAHARGQSLARVDFTGRQPGRAWNRTPADLEALIIRTRAELREHSVLGEYGAAAIAAALTATQPQPVTISQATIYRVLERRGALDGQRRQRRPAPPKGWYLPAVASSQAEMDSVDFIADLKIAGGPLVSVLTAISLHGALTDAWIMSQRRTTSTIEALQARWQAAGLPAYAQFDNDPVFHGSLYFVDVVGRLSRFCLALGVIPVFAPPREPGLQNAIEGFNGLWQSKVWQRHHFASVAELQGLSAAYIAAHRTKTAHRRDHAPERRPFPKTFHWDPDVEPQGQIIYIRRSSEQGAVDLLGRSYAVDVDWPHRLVRCEVDFTHHHIQFYALRRQDPPAQPMLREVDYLPKTRRKRAWT